MIPDDTSDLPGGAAVPGDPGSSPDFPGGAVTTGQGGADAPAATSEKEF